MKKRILFGLAPLFILLLVMGIYAVALFTKLGNSVDVILKENFRSVVAGQEMKEAAERMDSALSFAMVGEEERGGKMYEQNVKAFKSSLDMELNNITLPGEQEAADKVKTLFERYVARADTFWKTQDAAARQKMYFAEMLPTFTGIKDTAQEIIRLNEANMVAADRQARDESSHSTRYMVFAVILGMGIAAGFAVRLQRSILLPIYALTAVSKELGEGKLDQIVPVVSADELGQLADAFNKMAAKLRSYRQVTSDQILQARQMTEITLSAFPDPIIALSSEGRIDFTNPAADKLFARVDLGGALPGAVQVEVERVLKGGEDYVPANFEKALCLRVADRETFLLPRVIGMRDENAHLFGAAVILQDVTRFRLLDEVKTNLVSTVSHELKTPLTSIRMGLHLLLEERIGPLNGKQAELLLAARDDSERLLRMINDMLDLARLEEDKSGSGRRVIPAGDLLEGVARELRDLVESRGIRLVSKASEGLPAVSVDPGQLAHVFSNFVSNALKYSKTGDEVTMQASADPQHRGRVRFSVIDHGPGIPPEFQGRLFERFFRLPGGEKNGVGLGLAIAKEIVTAQGGAIGVNSKPGKGSEFYFDLPTVSPSLAGGPS